jgi:hypothetical protein
MGIGYKSKYKGVIKKESLKHPEKYADNQDIVYRSGLERNYFYAFDKNPAVLKWMSESLIIPYCNPLKDGRISRYYPDIILKMKDKEDKIINMILEIKPQSELNNLLNIQNLKNTTKKFWRALQNKAKWEASISYCEKQQQKTSEKWIFMVITEKDLSLFQ